MASLLKEDLPFYFLAEDSLLFRNDLYVVLH